MPREHDDLGHDHLGDAPGVRKRRVEYWNAAAVGPLEIDLIGTNAEATHREEPTSLCEGSVGDPGLAPDTNQVDVFDARRELFRAQGARQSFEVEPFGAEKLVRARVDVLEEEDLDAVFWERRFVAHPAACTAGAMERLARRTATWQGSLRGRAQP